MISKETLKNNIRTTYNKSFKTKLKVITLASIRQLKRLTRHIYIVKTEQMARHSPKS